MNKADTSAASDPLADWPLHHLLFVKLRNSPIGLAKAQRVADVHGVSIAELKAHCRLAGADFIARDGVLNAAGQRVYDWAKS